MKDTTQLINLAIKSMYKSQEDFSGGDVQWLNKNEELFYNFYSIAEKERARNNKISSWGVAHEVRKIPDISQKESKYKLNNNHISLMSHVYNSMPAREDFFKIKSRKCLELSS